MIKHNLKKIRFTCFMHPNSIVHHEGSWDRDSNWAQTWRQKLPVGRVLLPAAQAMESKLDSSRAQKYWHPTKVQALMPLVTIKCPTGMPSTPSNGSTFSLCLKTNFILLQASFNSNCSGTCGHNCVHGVQKTIVSKSDKGMDVQFFIHYMMCPFTSENLDVSLAWQTWRGVYFIFFQSICLFQFFYCCAKHF